MGLLYRIEELRTLEARARAGLAPGTLMQRAGRAAAARIHAWVQEGRRAGAGAEVLVLCGPGDNGGDGFVCATALQALGHRCCCWAPQASTSADARNARAQWLSGGGPIVEAIPSSFAFDVIVDALLGIGAQRPLGPPFLSALQWARGSGVRTIALDIPSGLNADTGSWIGEVAGAPAWATITFLGDKPGLHLLEGPDAAGAIDVQDLEAGDQSGSVAGQLLMPEQFRALLRPRPRNANKGDFGTVVVVGGAAGMVGAALLAARAALRLGAGKVIVDCMGAPALAVDPLQAELMLRPQGEIPGGAVLVAGCGMGTDAGARARLAALLEHRGIALFDADALNCIAADAQLANRLRHRVGTSVITPHPGEAARLLATDAAQVQRDRIAAALHLAQHSKSIVVLKGAGSVIAEPGGRYAINPTGTAALASAGTGDVLAGMIGALMAQLHDPVRATQAAVWLHGRAAELFGRDIGMVASDIAPLAVQALAQLRDRG